MDIDIDFQTSFDPTKIMAQAIPASMVKNDSLTKHPCGHYFQTIPVDPYTGLAAIPFDKAEDFGFFKVDFLHLSTLDHFSSKHEIRESIERKDTNWSLLQDSNQVEKLFQVKKSADLLRRLKPTSVQELADCIALIRPGKKHLVERYLRDKVGTRKELYSPCEDPNAYWYKKSHALSYALTIVLELHLIADGKL